MSTLSQITTALESDKSAIRQAILSGGGTCPEGHGFDDFAADIATIPADYLKDPEAEIARCEKVRFYDYDGTLLHEYTKAQFLALSAMPTNPSHSGMTAEGWNWTLSDAKTYVETYGALNIGQTYTFPIPQYIDEHPITPAHTDGKTRIVIDFNLSTITNSNLLSVYIPTTNISAGTYTVDWGDGSVSSNVSNGSSASHKYSTKQEYTVTITVNSGYIGAKNFSYNPNTYGGIIGSNSMTSSYIAEVAKCIKSVEMGSGIKLDVTYSFANCTNLTSVYLSTDSISDNTIYTRTFSSCSSLTSVNIPSNVTQISQYAFSGCTVLSYIYFPSSVTTIGQYAFSGCRFASIHVPNNITSIDTYAFSGCSNLETVIFNANINTIPNYCFNNCTKISSLIIGQNITQIGSYNFSGCKITHLELANVTTIGSYSFQNLHFLKTLIFKNGVSLNSYSFQYCGQFDCVIFNRNSLLSSGANAPFSDTTARFPVNGLAADKGISLNVKTDEGITIGVGGGKAHILITTGLGSSYIECDIVKVIKISSSSTMTTSGKVFPRALLYYPNSYSIADEAFDLRTSGVQLEYLYFSEGLSGIGTNNFRYCGRLNELVIPDSCTTIGNYAFQYTSLKVLTLGTNLTSIGTSAFSLGSASAADGYVPQIIKFRSTTPPTLSSATSSIFGITIYVPRGTLSSYQNATNYPNKNYNTYIEYDVE